MKIRRNSAREWILGKSIVKIENTLEHWLNQKQYSPEFRGGLIKLRGVPFEQVLIKAIENKFDDLSDLPDRITFLGNEETIRLFDDVSQKFSIVSGNTV